MFFTCRNCLVYFNRRLIITEESVGKLLVQQEHASSMQSETVETLQKLNQTFQFLLSVTENSRDQLNWIQGLVTNMGIYPLILRVYFILFKFFVI